MEILGKQSELLSEITFSELVFGIIVIVCIVQAIILIFIWCDRHKIKIRCMDLKQENEILQLSAQYPGMHRVTTITATNTTQPVRTLQPALEVDKDKTLAAAIYSSLQKLMKEDKIYHDPRLTRDEVVSKLGTSRKTFLEALQSHINMTFIEYTNKFRLDEAVELLENEEYTNETIAEEVGFGSVNTFYRQFRQKYGISPSEYRRALTDNLVASGF